jgi:polyhydroxybutyrate depolymerase
MVPGDTERTVTVGGTQRMYLLHIPPGLTAGQPLPLVLVFHDLFANAEYARQVTGFDDIADAHGFLVAYPNGSGPDPNSLSFNAGPCCGIAAEQNIDDEAFVRTILSDLGTVARIDPSHIYSTGWGNGAFFSNRLGCDMSGTFAAIATVNGALPYDPCQPEQHISVIHLHGLKDKFMPYAGGGRKIGTLDQPYPPARDVVAAWATRDGCSDGAQETQDGLVTRIVFNGCPAGINVEIDTLSGIGHSWPSQYAVPVSEMIWNFFAAYPKP